jgi:outer membrane protein assembly factor BamD (BamD/ComL family)
MIDRLSHRRHAARLVIAACLFATIAACGKKPPLPLPGAMDADKFLFERGQEELKERHWLSAREYFRRLFDTYPRSPYRTQSKLGIGDAYLGEGRLDSLILAANEFREFLQFFPVDRHQRSAGRIYEVPGDLSQEHLPAGRRQALS